MKTILLIIILVPLIWGCSTPKSTVRQMVFAGNVHPFLTHDCLKKMKTADSLWAFKKTKTLQIHKPIKKGNVYYVNVLFTDTDGTLLEFTDSRGVDLRLRVVRESGKWKVLLPQCVDLNSGS
ncbi:hypothetical protein [Runella salmonicolor]|uniref:DUF4878 domain-containing protein n=1 Tax=Runella salmonicolor TaxID=2950278 RepID=A0ABT1FP48_9BACT|nr:hypothetical protein [Runella salmonicolor]MCP1383501.1 hypothetical protein [Runella salmonicolor]